MRNSRCRIYLYWALAHPVVGPPFQVQDRFRKTALLSDRDYEAGRTVALILVFVYILEQTSFNICFVLGVM